MNRKTESMQSLLSNSSDFQREQQRLRDIAEAQKRCDDEKKREEERRKEENMKFLKDEQEKRNKCTIH